MLGGITYRDISDALGGHLPVELISVLQPPHPRSLRHNRRSLKPLPAAKWEQPGNGNQTLLRPPVCGKVALPLLGASAMWNLFSRVGIRGICACLALTIHCAGCSNKTTTVASGDGGPSVLPQCSWPAAYGAADAAIGECQAARVYLHCQGSNGGGEGCLSDNPTECPGPNAMPGVTYSNCENQCNPDEYALGCGAPGPGPWPQPPTTCRMLPAGPGGGTISCCPCGS